MDVENVKPIDRKPICHPRKRFADEQSARSASYRINYSSKGVDMKYVEYCSDCKGYHLTGRKP